MTDFDVEAAAGVAKTLGWDTESMGVLGGPSSTWVDEDEYTTWSGPGFDSFRRAMRDIVNV